MNRYEGEWKEGKAHGKGIYYYADGDVYVYRSRKAKKKKY
jgi:hypothetical protein